MAETKRGGAREGAGRPATGAKTKCYTITLPIEDAELLEERAAQLHESVNKYLRDIIKSSAIYSNVSSGELFIDDTPDGPFYTKD